MQLTIIISYYKKVENLQLILEALNRQSFNQFEVIVSEDDYNPDTKPFLDAIRPRLQFPIQHLNQEKDDGFQKNKMLNKSIYFSKSDRLVFIDGDCVPHPKFAEAYAEMEEGYFYQGRAVMLSPEITKSVFEKNDLSLLNFTTILFSKSTNKKEGLYIPYLPLSRKCRGIVGRNWGVYKKHLRTINGFNNEYMRPCIGEDTDIEWRLKAAGIQAKSMKNKGIVYHLYHESHYGSADFEHNREIMLADQAKNLYVCVNGYEQTKASIV